MRSAFAPASTALATHAVPRSVKIVGHEAGQPCRGASGARRDTEPHHIPTRRAWAGAPLAASLVLCVSAFVAFTPVLACAQALPAEWERRDLEPRGALTRVEVQMVQDALIWVGHYTGLKDGGWGAGTDRALQSWRRASGSPPGGPLSRAELAALFAEAVRARTGVGWTMGRDPNTGFWFGWPSRVVRPPRSFHGDLSYGSDYDAGTDDRLEIATRVTRIDGRALVNEVIGGEYARRIGVTQIGYRLDRPDRQVASFDTSDGRSFYIRYDRFGGEWRGFMVVGRSGSPSLSLMSPISAEFTGTPTPTVNSSDPRDAPTLAQVLPFVLALPPSPVTATDRGGRQETPIVASKPQQDGVGGAGADVSKPSPPPVPQPARREETGSGTAFVVRRDGTMLTNAHVVEDCAGLALADGTVVRVVAADGKRDLALVRAARPFEAALAFRRDQTIDHGERVHVFGYPYYRLVSESLNITDGIVTSLTGLRGRTVEFQISANMQPGNSGGPVLDDGGRVIGVAVAVLNSLAVARVTGSLPQGINYAIRGQVADAFLLENGIVSDKQASTGGRDLREIARQASELVQPLICYK